MKLQNLLTVDDVRISTTTVNIQVIRIGAKQMTLAVFRQLRRLDIFDSYGNLLAPPWGWVNYDRSGDGGKPFIFSYESALYRCNVNLEQHRQLALKPEVKETQGESRWDQHSGGYTRETIRTPTGKWLLEAPLYNYYRLSFGLFDSKLGAQKHLENRLESIATLEAAPQLFIAV